MADWREKRVHSSIEGVRGSKGPVRNLTRVEDINKLRRSRVTSGPVELGVLCSAF